MNWHRWLAALFVMLALAACAQGSEAPYAPYSHKDRNRTSKRSSTGASRTT